MILTSQCRLSGVGVVRVHAVSPCYWLLRTSGSLPLGRYFKRTSHLFCEWGTPQALTFPRESLKPAPSKSTRLCLKTVVPSKNGQK